MSYSFFPADTDASLLFLFFSIMAVYLLLIGGVFHGIKTKSRKWFWSCAVVLVAFPFLSGLLSKLFKLL